MNFVRAFFVPLSVPILGAMVIFDAYARRIGWKQDGPRRSTWYWRQWWWIGYHGLYQIDWWLKRRALAAALDDAL